MTKQEIIERFDSVHEMYDDIAWRITNLYENLAVTSYNKIDDELDYINHKFYELDERYKGAYRGLHDALFSTEVDDDR